MEEVKEQVIENTDPVKDEQETQEKSFMQHMKDFFFGKEEPKETKADEVDETEKKEDDPVTSPTAEDVQKLIAEERAKWEAEKAEEERLKKLTPEERLKAEQDNVKKELEETKSKLKEKEFKETAITNLTSKGYPVGLADILPYKTYADQADMEVALNKVMTVFENSMKEVLLSKVKQTTPRGLKDTSAPVGDTILKQIDETIRRGGY